MRLNKQKDIDINRGNRELSIKEKTIGKEKVRIPEDNDTDVSPELFMEPVEKKKWKKLSQRKKERIRRKAEAAVLVTCQDEMQKEELEGREKQKKVLEKNKENQSRIRQGNTNQTTDRTKKETGYAGAAPTGRSQGSWSDTVKGSAAKIAVRTAKKTAEFFRENLMHKEQSQELAREDAKKRNLEDTKGEGKDIAVLGILALPQLGTMAVQFLAQSVFQMLLVLMLVVVLCIPVMLAGVFAGFFGGSGTSLTAMQDGACYLSAKYESHGECGSIGSGGMGEYGFDKDYSLVEFVSYCYEKDPVTYAEFAPFLTVSGNEMYYSTAFREIWMRLATKEKRTFEADQTIYTYDHYFLPAATLYTSRYGYDFVNAPDAVKACVTSFAIRDGAATAARYFAGTTAESDAETIIRRAYEKMQAKRPLGTVSGPRWVDEEQDCLQMLYGTLDIYEPDTSPSGYGGIDWSWKRAGDGNGDIVSLALSKVGCSYSQTNRDGEGSYDCSSLVYRLYAQLGITYLSGLSAAEEARYLETHGMGITEDMLQPGDLIFYSYQQNGRYKNISHVAIYIGDGKMVHAANPNRGVVCDPYRASNIGVYARPQ